MNRYGDYNQPQEDSLWDPKMESPQDEIALKQQKVSEVTRKVRRRNRQITSCLECRRRKLKCDRQSPCTHCVRIGENCLYLNPVTDAQTLQKFAVMKDRMSALEENFGRESNGNKADTAHQGSFDVNHVIENLKSPDEDATAEGEGWDMEEPLESPLFATLDTVYDDDVDDDVLMDLGVRLGRMRVTERIGGWVRPMLAEELNDTLNKMTGRSSEIVAKYQGPEDAQARSLKDRQAKFHMSPGPDYIAPTPSLFFPAGHASDSPLDYLPSQQMADLLISWYKVAVHLVAPTVLWPVFKTQYNMFWASISSGVEPSPSKQALVFAAMFSAAVSMDEAEITNGVNTTKTALVNELRAGTETALSKANFLQTNRLDTMQALVMYLIPQARSEVSRAQSTLVGMAIRLAQCMGLHRDGSHFAMPAIAMQVRRLLWHQLCFLDMRTCEAVGPSLQIRRNEYDTQFPLNMDDEDFRNDSESAQQDRPNWTNMTLFRIRAEIADFRCSLWSDMVRIDRREKSLTTTLVKIQQMCQTMQAKYGAMFDETVPVQQLGKRVLEIGMSGWYVQVLHRYMFNPTHRMPDRLRELVIEHGLKQMENVIALETSPELAPWSWYRGAINQFHPAIFLTREVYADPTRKDAAKIWKCLDYIFDTSPDMSLSQKGQLVMTDLRDLMAAYHRRRKVKLTTRLEERVLSRARSVSSSASHGETIPNENPQANPSTDEPAISWANNEVFVDSSSGFAAPPGNILPHDFIVPPSMGLNQESSGNSRVGPAKEQDAWVAMEDIDWAEWDKCFFPEQNIPQA